MFKYIDFGDIRYIGPIDSNKTSDEEYKWDENYYNKLKANRQYTEAADYASRYHFRDLNVQNSYIASIEALRSKGRRYEKAANTAKTLGEPELLDFIDNVFIPGGLETALYDENGNYKGNKYYDEFVKYKELIGSLSTITITDRVPTFTKSNLEYNTVAPKSFKFTFYNNDEESGENIGVSNDKFGRLIRTPHKNVSVDFNKFIKELGYTKDDLASNGIKVAVNKYGNTSIAFDINNAYANKILYTVGKLAEDTKTGWGYSDEVANIQSFDDKGNEIIDNRVNNKTQLMRLASLYNFVNDLEKKEEEVYEEVDKNNIHSSIDGEPMFDGLEALNKQLENGEIKRSDYNAIYAEKYGYVMNMIEHDYKHDIYTNYFAAKEGNTDRTNVKVEGSDREELLNALSAIDPKRKKLYTRYSNGQFGVLVKISAVESKGQLPGQDRFEVFIPGLLHEEAQQKLNQDTKARSLIIADDLRNYNSSYTTTDGQIIQGSDGEYLLNGKVANEETVKSVINKDIIIKDASEALVSNYMNQNGEIINKTGFENLAKTAAIKGANEIFPGALYKEDGTRMSVEEMMQMLLSEDSPFYNSDKATMLANIGEHFNYHNFDKIHTMLDIYWAIMANLANFPVKQ